MGNFWIRVFAVIVLSFITTIVVRSDFLKKEVRITGETMGTTYSVKVVTKLINSKHSLQVLIDQRLSEISGSLSTYDVKSEISQFNSIMNLESKFWPSHDFLSLLLISKKLHELVGDIWDPTIDPIVNAWGFGRDGFKNRVLKPDELELLLDKVDFKRAITFCNDGSIKKGFAGVTLDLASIAKGFGVDQISFLLHEKGFENFLVEIGGEVYAKGYRKDSQCWRVGINYPDKMTSSDRIYKTVVLSDRAIATSGDYRNFVKIHGETYSHIIDPRTGYPISNCVVSVSVLADNCTIADGLATALMVVDPHYAVDLVESFPLVECMVITTDNSKTFKSYTSSGIELVQE